MHGTIEPVHIDFSPLNILAFLFGPFYYLAKGMWKEALALGAIFGVQAHIDSYKKMVLGDDSWWPWRRCGCIT